MKKVILLIVLLLVLTAWFTFRFLSQRQYAVEATGLSWQYCHHTQLDLCPEPELFNWMEALRYCDALSWGGDHNWRLPHRAELLSIVDWMERTPATVNKLAADTKDNIYWSASSESGSPEKAYYTSFFSGYSYANSKRVEAYVRCVRDIK
ncbi:MAG: DUF1566 domain-containing protein [Methyloprofundus sp.]|nr:DUF1566 domain-containing protein [Methyloprofundus sp.]